MERFREVELVLLAGDLAGFTRAVAALAPGTLARFLDAYYERASAAVLGHGGRVVKFMGDACFALFPKDLCAEAVDCAEAMAVEQVLVPGTELVLAPGINLHLAVVAEGEFGVGADRRYDVVGAEVNHLFRMGSGPGVRISEPVYLRLPEARRAAWRRQEQRATYTRDVR